MIQINGLTITHRKDLRVILEDFNLVLNDGDKAVIIGEEGNGKSTLLKWLYDPELTEEYAEAKGTRVLGNEKLGYLPQELPEKDRQKTLYEFFTEEECFWNRMPKELAELTGKFGVEPGFFYREQALGSLSGGEKVKAQLMKLLIQEPTALLLDEPSNDIDLATMELLETVINGWEKIVLFISHDETLIENTANMVVHLEQIRRKTKSRYTIAKMPYRDYVQKRLHSFERQEQQALNDRRERKLREERFRKIYQSVEHAQAVVSRQNPGVAKNLKDKMHVVKAMGRRFARQDEEMTELPEQEEAIFFKLGGQDASMPAGRRRRCCFLKMSMSGANVLVLDEPTRNFSPLSGPVIRKMIREFPGVVISISHDRKYIAEVCGVVYRLTPEGLVREVGG